MNCPNCLVECITDKAGGWLCLKCQFTAPKNYMVINSLMAWVMVDEAGNEGIAAFQTPQGIMPMMGGDPAKILAMKPLADHLATRTKMKIKLLRFSQREEV